MIRRLLLVTGLAMLSYAACDRHANAADDQCDRAIHAAEAAAYTATRTQHEAMDPDEARVASELVAAAVAQLQAARALCDVLPVASTADPFESDTTGTSDAEFSALLDYAGISETGNW